MHGHRTRADPLLVVDGLQVRYQEPRAEVVAVDGVSFTLDRHETLGLVGESGSGKTSVCSALLGLLPAKATRCASTLTFDGHDLLTADDDELRELRGRGISWVPQHPGTALAPTTSVGRQLRWYFGARLDDPAIVETLRDLGLGVVLERPRDLPSQFSGGQLQRLVIAIAVLAHAPALVLADEPTSALDPDTARQVLDTLRAANARVGAAMILVSHDVPTVATTCDRIGVMRDGHLVELGSTDALLTRPRHAYTRTIMGTQPRCCAPSVPAAPDTSGRALVVDHLTRDFGTQRVIDDLSFALAPGEILALVGASGAGKSTLARLLAGTLAPTAGEITVAGHLMPKQRTRADARLVQLVTQQPRAALNRRHTVAHALRQPLRVHRVGESRPARDQLVAGMLHDVELPPEVLDRRPHRLSGGQVARVVLARALILEPPLLVLDEPTASLDVTVKDAVVDVLLGLRDRRGTAMVLVTHDLDLARRVGDRVAELRDGTLDHQVRLP